MHLLIRRLLPGCFACSLLSAAPAPTTLPADNNRIASAIVQLGDPDYQARQRASRFLWSTGSAAEAALAQAAQSSDPEVAARAREILADLRIGVRPDAPSRMIELVHAYRRGQPQEKRAAFSGLLQLGPSAYPIVARLLAAETDPALRASISNELSARALGAVHTFLAEADFTAAEQFLDIALADGSDAAARSYAAYHLLRGGIDRKITHFRTQVEANRSPKDAKVLTYLYRAQGDLPNARWAAERAKDPELLDSILFEAGDWKTLTDHSRLSPADATDLEKLAVLATYQHLAGDKNGFDQSLARLRQFADGLRGANLFVAKILLLNDRPDEAIALHIKHNQPQYAFELLCAQQKFQEAFELAGKFKAGHPDAPVLQCLQAKTLYSLGEEQRARAILNEQTTLLRNGGNPAAHRALIEAEYQCGRVDRAFAHYARTLALGQSTSDRLLGALFPQQAAEAVVYWSLLRKRFPGDEPEQTLSRVRNLLEGKCSPDELKDLAAIAPPAALQLNNQQRSQFLSALTQTMVAAGQDELAKSLLQSIGDSLACMELGNLAAARKQWPAAADWYARAMEKDRTGAAPRYLHGWALLQAGQQGQGRALLAQASLMPLAKQQLRRDLAEALDKAGLAPQAREQDELIIRTGDSASRELSDSLIRAASQARRRGDYLTAASYWQRSLLDCVKPETNFVRQELYLTISHMIHRLRAGGLLRAGKIEEAMKEMELCAALLPGEISLAIDLVPELEKAGRQQDAEALFTRTLQAQEKLCADYPDSSTQHNSAAWLLARCRRNLDQALAHAAKAVELAPNNTAFLDTLAEVHFQRGDKPKAIELLNKCIQLEPTSDRHKLALKRLQESSPQSDPIE